MNLIARCERCGGEYSIHQGDFSRLVFSLLPEQLVAAQSHHCLSPNHPIK